MANRPIKKWRRRGVEIALWEGNSFTIRKTYKDKATGEYKESKSFFKEELGDLYIITLQALLEITGEERGINENIEVTTVKGEEEEVPF